METGEIHSDGYFVCLIIFHFNFLDGGQALQKFIEVPSVNNNLAMQRLCQDFDFHGVVANECFDVADELLAR